MTATPALREASTTAAAAKPAAEPGMAVSRSALPVSAMMTAAAVSVGRRSHGWEASDPANMENRLRPAADAGVLAAAATAKTTVNAARANRRMAAVMLAPVRREGSTRPWSRPGQQCEVTTLPVGTPPLTVQGPPQDTSR
jgi:hypothetical protein